jgi:hypothetical protein
MTSLFGPLDLSDLTFSPQYRWVVSEAFTDVGGVERTVSKVLAHYYIHGSHVNVGGESYTRVDAENVLALYDLKENWWYCVLAGGGFFGRFERVRIEVVDGVNGADVALYFEYIGTNTTHKRGFDISGLGSVSNDWGF